MPLRLSVPAFLLAFGLSILASAQTKPAGDAASACIDCHSKTTPSIVSDWKLSKHSQLEVSCVVCHGDGHSSASDVAKVHIPTPETCKQCHATQVEQYMKGKHSKAWAAMKAMPTIHWQPMAMIEGQKGCGGCHKVGVKSAAEIIELRKHGSEFGAASCDSCHTRHTFSVEEANSLRLVRPATWASIIRSGKCIRHPSTASAAT